MRSLFLLSFLLLFLEVYLMDLYHGILVFSIVIRIDSPWRTHHLNYLSEFVHLGPMSSIESISISQVNISPIGE